MNNRMPRGIFALALVAILFSAPPLIQARELTSREALQSIDRGKMFLLSQQKSDGSWAPADGSYEVGVTSLALLSLINSGMTAQDEPVQRALGYLRSHRDAREPNPTMTYEISLMISALAAAKDGQRDKARILRLAQKLASSQGKNGMWSYNAGGGGFNLGGDNSNTQYAILGLRDAAEAGIAIDRTVWERARRHWMTTQNADGGWSYSSLGRQPSTGSMTVAGIASLVIINSMLRDEDDFERDGKTPKCCPEYEDNDVLKRALKWMERHFAVGHNPGGGGTWTLYYLYGLERAGRLSGRRFFGQHDWYREGADYLVAQQSKAHGHWRGVGTQEADPVIGTSFALLFLSKGLAPVLINKMKFGPTRPGELIDDDGDWNRHRNDIPNLTSIISGLPKWPKLLTWQIIDIERARTQGGVKALLQAPVLYLAGQDAPQLTEEHVALLKQYIEQGGFIFAVSNCDKGDFDDGFRDLVEKRLFTGGEAKLELLPADHPVYRSEYLLQPESVPLYGVDVGCRTAIIYSKYDHSCLWEKWARQDPPKRRPDMKTMIEKSKRVGVNVIAYATGRELLNKIEIEEQVVDAKRDDPVERGLLQIAKIRHTGGWDAAPRALRNLMHAMNETVGLTASTRNRSLPATDDNLFKYPVVFMHGRTSFQLSRAERQQLREYLDRGGMLFADACCGAKPFDESFRNLVRQLYPDERFERIPMDHEMFSTKIGHDIRQVKRRAPEIDDPDQVLNTDGQMVEPFLEGIQVEDRFVIVYSKYDISCALERQASVACAGYVHEDAVKIGINIVLYALLQDVRYAE